MGGGGIRKESETERERIEREREKEEVFLCHAVFQSLVCVRLKG